LASLFWSFMGVGLRIARMLDLNRVAVRSLHAD
jgi:hypothetical protein